MKKKLKIAVIAPPFTTVPPKGQGGTERVVFQMTEGFLKKGHRVTLFGAGKCKTKAKFVQVFKKTISEQKFNPELTEASRSLRIETAYMAKVMMLLIKEPQKYDVIFNHTRGGYLFMPLQKLIKTPIISILHMQLFSEINEVLKGNNGANIVSISNSQRTGFKDIKYLSTVYNGVDLKEFYFQKKPKDYLLFIGAIGPHKNPKDAILSAKRAKEKLIIASGKIREPYFTKEIKPLIDGKQIKFIGEVRGKKKINIFRNAKALLFPVKMREAFGIVMIEAMSCGTPVIAYSNGAVKEVVKHNKTGFIVENVNQMAKAIKQIEKIKRQDCRTWVENNFSVEKMVDNYEKIYYRLLKKHES